MLLTYSWALLKDNIVLCTAAGFKLMKMEMELWCVLFVFLPFLVIGSGDIYIVTMEGEPILSYSGGVEGFAPTATDSVEEMDITR